MEPLEEPREFQPILLSRRGELFAWLTAILSILAWLILRWKVSALVSIIPFLAVFFVFAALSISFGNWVDRRTLLRLEPTGVSFRNGLRNVHLEWSEINRMEVLNSSLGSKVRVYGEKAHFDFRTLGEFRVSGEVKGRMGFAEGETILSTILKFSGLKEVEHTGNSYYYMRQ